MHHLAAFYVSVTQNASYLLVPGVADGGLPRNAAGAYIMPGPMKILAASVQGVTTNRAQIQAPSLRNLAYPEIAPIQQTAIDPAVTNANFRSFGDNGPTLLANESLNLAASENNTGASPTVGALWLAPSFRPAPAGPVFTIVATTSNTLVAQAWSLSTLAFETVLAAGRYSVVGMRVQCDDANLARLVFPGSTNLRPGVLALAAVGDAFKYDQFRMGNMGEFGQFDFQAPPQLEVFGHTAGAETATVMLDVVKIR